MTKPSPTRLAVEYLPIDSLAPDPANARLHKPPQVAAIARSISTFGFNVPVLVDDSGKLIAGHGRLAGAARAGLREVPVIRLSHLTEQQRRAYMIADNRLTDLSRWDEKLLGETLRDLSVADLDFELDAIGFSVAEIDLRIDGLDGVPDAEEAPVLIEAEAITIAGDLWQLGRHRLLCGDALDVGDWERLMQGEKAAIGFSDPPYNLPVHGFISGLG